MFYLEKDADREAVEIHHRLNFSMILYADYQGPKSTSVQSLKIFPSADTHGLLEPTPKIRTNLPHLTETLAASG